MVDGKRDARNRYFSLSVVTCAKQTNPTAVNPFVPFCDEGGGEGGGGRYNTFVSPL